MRYYNVKTMYFDEQNTKKTIIYGNTINYDFQSDRETIRGESKNRQSSINSSMRRTKNAICDYAKANTWEYFVTITFDKEKIDRYDYDKITKKLSKKLNNIKRKQPNFKYIIVPEQHKDGAWHFHGLFSNIENFNLKKTKKRDIAKREIYNLENFNLGFTTATKITDSEKVSNYLTKYITKDLLKKTFNKKKYWLSYNLTKPRVKVEYLDDYLKLDYSNSLKNESSFSKLYFRVNEEDGEVIKLAEYFISPNESITN